MRGGGHGQVLPENHMPRTGPTQRMRPTRSHLEGTDCSAQARRIPREAHMKPKRFYRWTPRSSQGSPHEAQTVLPLDSQVLPCLPFRGLLIHMRPPSLSEGLAGREGPIPHGLTAGSPQGHPIWVRLLESPGLRPFN